MGRGLVLVRHALPEVDPRVPPERWELGSSGRADAASLGSVLDVSAVFSSTEPKALQTAEAIRADVRSDERFGEVDRPHEWTGDHRERAAGYLGAGRDGWEDRSAVATRFAAGVRDALASSEGDIAVVDHGMALSLFLATRTEIDVVTFWEALTFPDAWRLDVDTRQLDRLYRGRPAPDV